MVMIQPVHTGSQACGSKYTQEVRFWLGYKSPPRPPKLHFQFIQRTHRCNTLQVQGLTNFEICSLPRDRMGLLSPVMFCVLVGAALEMTEALSIVPLPCSRGTDLKIYCGRGSSGKCPGESHCDIDPVDRYATCCCTDISAFCPNCTRPVNCLVDPCRYSSCRAYPSAVCRSDYCGGCNARFYLGKREVTKQCNDIRPCSRRGGRPLKVSCGRGSPGPCPGSSYCDIHPTDAFATCCCNDTAATCPDCTKPFRCLRNPCSVSSCSAYPSARCIPDYCGGCKARYYLGKREVTKQCNNIRPCSRRGGRPLKAFCGLGSSKPCPGSSYCDIHPVDAFAVCCCNDTAATCPDCTQTLQLQSKPMFSVVVSSLSVC